MRFFASIFLCALWTLAAASQGTENIRKSIDAGVINVEVEAIEPGPIEGIYTLKLKGGRVLYATEDGRHFIQGQIYKAEGGVTVNLTKLAEAEGIQAAIGVVPKTSMIIFPAEEEAGQITVFTDSSCPFCKKFHGEIESLNEAGITVRYLAYPRDGLDSDAYRTMVSVWCAEDKKSALTKAIGGKRVPSDTCSNPVAEQYQLGKQIGVKGTPTIVFEDGREISGYKPASFVSEIARGIR